MISGLLPIYSVSAAVIGLLALFGHQNRRAGYKKSRRNVASELNAIGAEWDEIELTVPQATFEKASVKQPAVAPQILAPMVPTEVAAFSGMLATLHSSLSKVASVHPQVAAQKVEAPELVAQ